MYTSDVAKKQAIVWSEVVGCGDGIINKLLEAGCNSWSVNGKLRRIYIPQKVLEENKSLLGRDLSIAEERYIRKGNAYYDVASVTIVDDYAEVLSEIIIAVINKQ